MTPRDVAALLARVETLDASATPGPWHVWDGPRYAGGGADLCIGAGDVWLANMDERHCKTLKDAAFSEQGCDDALTCDICSFGPTDITEEQSDNAKFIAEARTLLPDLATALRAALADQRRYQWLKQTDEVTLCGIAYRVRAACIHDTADGAIDAAIGGGGV